MVCNYILSQTTESMRNARLSLHLWFHLVCYLHENSCEFVVIGVSLSEPRIADFAVDFHSPEVIFSL